MKNKLLPDHWILFFHFPLFKTKKCFKTCRMKEEKILGRSSYSLKSRANKMGPIKPINSLHFSRYIAWEIPRSAQPSDRSDRKSSQSLTFHRTPEMIRDERKRRHGTHSSGEEWLHIKAKLFFLHMWFSSGLGLGSIDRKGIAKWTDNTFRGP